MTNNQLIYLAGPGHSGSTLLDMLLGGHREISALGEIHRFYLSLNKSSRPHLCDCGKAMLQCPFWINVIERVAHITGKSRENLQRYFYTTDPANINIPDDGKILYESSLPKRYSLDIGRVLASVPPAWVYWAAGHIHPRVKLYRRIAQNSHLLFDAVRDVAKTPIIVDSTKNPIRLRTLFLERPLETKILYLIRDGRAVTHSRLRRHSVKMSDAAKIWLAEHKKQTLVQRDIPKDKILKVKYEDLCRRPEKELRRICTFLDVEYDPGILAFWNTERHAVGGNPMRFDQGGRAIKLNERWRAELSKTELYEFERVGGKVNRAFGYD